MVMMSDMHPLQAVERLWDGEKPQGVLETVPAFAYVNHGRWVADCPAPGCNEAQLLHPAGIYFCLLCGNKAFSGKWLKVVWPDNKKEIEDLLQNRPTPNQNWMPGETSHTLVSENIQHAIPPVVP